MKKSILLFFALILVVGANAQKKAYLSLGAGAGIGTARSYELYTDGKKVHPVGLGTGLNVNFRAGYFLNEFMAIELGFAYRLGFSTKVDVSETIGEKSSTSSGNIKYSSNMFQLVPALIISPNISSGKVRPYARLGVIVGILPSIKTNIDVTSTGILSSVNMVATLKYSGGVAIGGSSALGCDFNLSDLLAIYVEIYYDALSYAPSKGEFTKFEQNGTDILPSMTTNDKEVKFVKDITGFTPTDSEPDQQLKTNYSLNSLGLNIGLKIKL
jgi:hypothetical protein